MIGRVRFQSLQEAVWIYGSWDVCYCPVHPSLLWSLHPDALKRHRSGRKNGLRAKGSNNRGPLKLGDLGGNFPTTTPPHCFIEGNFQVCFFSRLVTLLMLMLIHWEDFSMIFSDFYKMISYTAWIFQTICMRLYSTIISSDHSILPGTCWTTVLHLQLPISRNFFSTKSTNIIINTNHNRIQQNSLLGPLWLCSSHIPPKKTGVDLQLHWYHFGSQWSSSMPLLYLGTASDHQTDWRWGGGWWLMEMNGKI